MSLLSSRASLNGGRLLMRGCRLVCNFIVLAQSYWSLTHHWRCRFSVSGQAGLEKPALHGVGPGGQALSGEQLKQALVSTR